MNDYSAEYRLKGDFSKDSRMLSTGVECISRELADLSRAFLKVGNDKISDQLFNIAEELEAIKESMKALSSNRIQSDLQDAQKISGAILSSCLAGMEIAKQDLTTKD